MKDTAKEAAGLGLLSLGIIAASIWAISIVWLAMVFGQ
jgi:hypothetical protein